LLTFNQPEATVEERGGSFIYRNVDNINPALSPYPHSLSPNYLLIQSLVPQKSILPSSDWFV
jgi:hypothetical protein